MIDKQTFRDAMSLLAAPVTIVTSDGPGGICGCTVSAVSSVSDEPPILLICVNRNSRNNAILKRNQILCVNVLRANQQMLAARFAQSLGKTAPDTRFLEAPWSVLGMTEKSSVALPFLNDTLVALNCHITDSAEIGSHTVFYCTVEAARFGVPGPGLIYFARDFHPTVLATSLTPSVSTKPTAPTIGTP